MSISADTPREASPEKGGTRGFAIRYVTGSLFECPAGESLAHCISQDCRMGAGIAALFRKRFGSIEELQEQKKTPGEVAVLQKNNRYIYYLITKEKASYKPTYSSLQGSLIAMKTHSLANGVTRISMPRIGCGLDKLSWDKVATIIQEVFCNTDICISVYTLRACRT
eukprot:gi/632953299/ref/XP_007892342.1/ PREDICTED: O-acetyl-ADP-ribose deacetylase 1 [Callorhinchus milii]